MLEKYPLVSVIVPVYRVEKYLQECINSIVLQTYSQLEIILVDDGSTDNCYHICDENAAKDSRIIVVHKENGGLSSARNAGLDIATGKYIAFVDADDTIHKKFIEVLVGLCIEYDCDIAQCDFLAITENSIKLPPNSQYSISFYNNKQSMYELCCGNNQVGYTIACNKIYKKHLFEDIRYPVGRIHEDEFTTYLLLWRAKKIVVINQYLYYYLQRKLSITRQKFSLQSLDVLEALRRRASFLKQQKLEEEYLTTLRTQWYSIEKNYRLLEQYIPGSEKKRKDLLEEKKRIEKMLPAFQKEQMSSSFNNAQMRKDCLQISGSRIVLYGAGNWGRKYYRWIKNNGLGQIVGWVDNSWYGMDNIEDLVKPLDMLLTFEFDYVLIAIKSREVQEEVVCNLICWGIPEHKIRTISIAE